MDAINIKIIMDSQDGTVVLKDGCQPVNVEIIHVDKEFDDYEDLKAYVSDLQGDPKFESVSYTTADFTENPYIPAPKEPEPQAGMVGRIKRTDDVKYRLRGKDVRILAANGGLATCEINGTAYSVMFSNLENLHFPEQTVEYRVA